ncbi:GntP family permease [Lawsonibacter hominis]|uniref:GntP family permease n=1 Tax=Lawsonibacter hominis TaxID=2763053 RepID=A0A8J6J7P0_9FIRM|nr:GntP family permease [Lawsonibacter hominis]MBC5734251.1 GntP family permease [Lawsonibacter hominis]
MNIIGLIGIFVALALLIILVYKGVHVVVAGALAAILVAVTNGLGATNGYGTIYLSGMGGFITANLPIYLWGGIFGELFNASGAARSIAKAISRLLKGKKEHTGVLTSILIVFIAGTLMSYGGISGIVLMFVLMPLTLEILKESCIPRYMAPGILLGALATAALSMPGSPQIQNSGPIQYLGTSSMAAAVPGFIGGAVVIVLNILFLNWAANREIAAGRVFLAAEDDIPVEENAALPNPVAALVPLVVTFVLFNLFKIYIGFSIIAGILAGILLFWRYLAGVRAILKLLGGAVASASVLCLSSAALAGFGSVVQATETFGQFSTAVTSIQGPPLFIAMFAIVLVTAICGSGPAAIGAALPMFKDTFAAMGVNMSALHRIAAFSATTLDTLPTNAGFIAATGLAKAETRQSYKYVGVCTVINTTIATAVVTLILTLAPGLA